MYTPIELLIVEDNPGDIRLYQEFFKSNRLSNNVTYIRNSAEMEKFLRREGEYEHATPPDLIMLSLRPFLLNGLQGLDPIRCHPMFKDIALVGLMGAASEEEGLPDRSAFTSYMVKPLDLDQLRSVLTKINSLGLVISRVPTPAQV